MCSILFSTKNNLENLDSTNFFLKFRGPDHTEVKQINDCLFVHNLLSITGEFTIQPYIDNNIVALYNGEVYNYRDLGNYKSDGACIIPLYKEHGVEFTKKLDGEFAICLVDFDSRKIIISADVFKTKPLFIALDEDGNVGCSSYRTPLEKLGHVNIFKANPNTTYVIDLDTGKLLNTFSLYEFQLNQYKQTYDDWVIAFKNAIDKRIANTEKNIFIGLSSGYDSGIIFSMLNDARKKFYTFTLMGTENHEVIEKRLELKSPESECYTLDKDPYDYTISNQIIRENTEAFRYTIHSSGTGYTEHINLIEDGGANNFATICRVARSLDCKICLSGTGADEIISDYGFNGNRMFNHSNFGGLFPEDLSTIFPWASFYGSTLESYIAKEEYVGGSFGIEMRYPFLDTQVVQEFLWLDHKLKNKQYKAPIHYYFEKNNYPYEKERKRGF